MNHSARRVNELSRQLGSKRYLEIGVRTGETFRDVAIADRTGVDPRFTFDTNELAGESTRLAECTSDQFFSSEPFSPAYDVAFIDGLHTFEQVVRDLSNTLLLTHQRSAIVIDDTLPSDVYSTIPDSESAQRHRKAGGGNSNAWNGDVFKTVFYIHDFLPGLNYRTIIGSGNPQTLVWRTQGFRPPLFNNLERISRLTYFDLWDHIAVLRATSEADAINVCVAEIKALS